MRRVAYLNNHNTAARFVVEMCTKSNLECYIPLKCPEKGSVREDDARALRTCKLPPDVENALDQISVYVIPKTITESWMSILKNWFDMVIFPPCGSANLLYLAQHYTGKLVVMEWGGISGVALSSKYSHIYHRPNVLKTVCYQHFDPEAPHLPLGINPKIWSVISHPHSKFSEPTVLIVISRLYNCFSRNYLTKMLNVIEEPSFNLIVIGKDHGDISFIDAYRSKWKSITVRSDLDIHEVYTIMKQAHVLLYVLQESALMQYSVLECLHLGTPVIYLKGNMFEPHLEAEDPLKAHSYNDVNKILDKCLSLEYLERQRERQKILLSILDDTEEKWKNFFEEHIIDI